MVGPMAGQAAHLTTLLDELEQEGHDPRALRAALQPVREEWRAAWAMYGDGPGGWERFAELRTQVDDALEPFAGAFCLPNQVDGVEALRQMVVRPALNTQLAPAQTASTHAPGAAPAQTAGAPTPPSAPRQRLVGRPVFVVSSP